MNVYFCSTHEAIMDSKWHSKTDGSEVVQRELWHSCEDSSCFSRWWCPQKTRLGIYTR